MTDDKKPAAATPPRSQQRAAPVRRRPTARKGQSAAPLLIWGTLVVAAIAGSAGAGFYTGYQTGLKEGANTALPILKAESMAVKERPEDAGGLTVPHQDKEIFSQLNKDEQQARAEDGDTVMTHAEEPIDRDDEGLYSHTDRDALPDTVPVKDGSAEAEEAAGDVVAEAKDDAAEAAQEAEAASSDIAKAALKAIAEKEDETAKAVEAKIADVAAKGAQAEKKAAEEPKQDVLSVAAAVLKKPTVDKNGAYRIQLGAFNSKGQAQKAWDRLNKSNGPLFSGYAPLFEEANVKGKVFVRLHVGPFGSRKDAGDSCAQMKSNKVDCLVVKR